VASRLVATPASSGVARQASPAAAAGASPSSRPAPIRRLPHSGLVGLTWPENAHALGARMQPRERAPAGPIGPEGRAGASSAPGQAQLRSGVPPSARAVCLSSATTAVSAAPARRISPRRRIPQPRGQCISAPARLPLSTVET
jgi:hypothetical protein